MAKSICRIKHRRIEGKKMVKKDEKALNKLNVEQWCVL